MAVAGGGWEFITINHQKGERLESDWEGICWYSQGLHAVLSLAGILLTHQRRLTAPILPSLSVTVEINNWNICNIKPHFMPPGCWPLSTFLTSDKSEAARILLVKVRMSDLVITCRPYAIGEILELCALTYGEIFRKILDWLYCVKLLYQTGVMS